MAQEEALKEKTEQELTKQDAVLRDLFGRYEKEKEARADQQGRFQEVGV